MRDKNKTTLKPGPTFFLEILDNAIQPGVLAQASWDAVIKYQPTDAEKSIVNSIRLL